LYLGQKKIAQARKSKPGENTSRQTGLDIQYVVVL
jgi:hypothetical protein